MRVGFPVGFAAGFAGGGQGVVLKPRPTVRAIAEVAGVSPSTASRALRDPTSVSEVARSRVRHAVEQIESAAPAAGSGVPSIGCLFIEATSGPRFGGFDALVWAGIAQVSAEHGCEVRLLNPTRNGGEESIPELCRSRGIDGLAVRIDDASASVLPQLAEAGIPAVVIAHKHDVPGVGYICVRSRETSRDAVSHLAKLGHRRIAFCKNYVSDQDHENRRVGYLEALEDNGLEADPALQIDITVDPDGGAAAINRMLALPDPPTAAYFADPYATIGALRRLRERGLSVPEDFSVVGFDDDSSRRLGSPVYTAVCQDAPRMARTAGQMLVRAMTSGVGEPPRMTLDSFFEVNASTGPAPASSSAERLAFSGRASP